MSDFMTLSIASMDLRNSEMDLSACSAISTKHVCSFIGGTMILIFPISPRNIYTVLIFCTLRVKPYK